MQVLAHVQVYFVAMREVKYSHFSPLFYWWIVVQLSCIGLQISFQEAGSIVNSCLAVVTNLHSTLLTKGFTKVLTPHGQSGVQS